MQVPPNTNRSLIRIPSRDAGRFIDAWLYYPHGESQLPRPLLVNWHGCGWILHNLNLDHEFCARVANENNMLVLDADYRKCPEHPFPKPLDDVEDTLKWVEQQDQFDHDRIALSGFSSGATLALVAASTIRDRFKLNIRIPVVFYPGADLSADANSRVVPHPVRPVPAFAMRLFIDSYVPDHELRKDPRISPWFADPTLFPDAVAILTCSGDSMSPEGNALANKLEDGKRKITHIELENVAHGFDKWCLKEGSYEWEVKNLAYTTGIKAIKEALTIS